MLILLGAESNTVERLRELTVFESWFGFMLMVLAPVSILKAIKEIFVSCNHLQTLKIAKMNK